jgi:hypothetical protein
MGSLGAVRASAPGRQRCRPLQCPSVSVPYRVQSQAVIESRDRVLVMVIASRGFVEVSTFLSDAKLTFFPPPGRSAHGPQG